ncbi:hypothetical protein Tco_1172909 [Tanacetum coccineum]
MYWKPYIRLKLVQLNTIPPGLDALVNTMEGVTCIAYMASQLLWQNQLRFVDHSVPDLRRSLELHHYCREINQWMFAGSGMRRGPTNQLKLHQPTEKVSVAILRSRVNEVPMPWPNSSDAERLLLAVEYASQNQYFGREMIRSPRGLSFAGVQATLGDDLMLLIDMVRMQSSLKYMLRSEEREVAKRGRLSGCVRSELNENKLKIILDPAAGNWPFVQATTLAHLHSCCSWCLAIAEGVVEEKDMFSSCLLLYNDLKRVLSKKRDMFTHVLLLYNVMKVYCNGTFTFVHLQHGSCIHPGLMFYNSTEALRPTVKTTVDLSTNVLYINDISSVLNLSIRSLPGDHGLPLQQVRICIPDVSDS